jgi:hypothetical protein
MTAGTTSSGTRTEPVRRGRQHTHRHRDAARKAVQENSTHVEFTVAGTRVEITMPPLDKLAFYAGLAGGAAVGLLEWPVAVLAGVGHLLSDDRHNRVLHALGEALDAAS